MCAVDDWEYLDAPPFGTKILLNGQPYSNKYNKFETYLIIIIL